MILISTRLSPFAVEFKIEDLFPRPEIEPAVRHGHDRFPAHDRPLEVRVGVVLAAVVAVLGVGLFGRELFQPHLIVVVQPLSSSLMKTLAVIFIAFASSRPSLIPLSRSASSTCGVMLTSPRRAGRRKCSSLR